MRTTGQYDFKTDLEANVKYEEAFMLWLKELNPGKKIIRATGNFKLWDVQMVNQDGTFTSYEIKRDYWFKDTQNVCVELYMDEEKQRQGWWFHSLADFIVYFVDDVNFFLIKRSNLSNAEYAYQQVHKKGSNEPYLGWHFKRITQRDYSKTCIALRKATEFYEQIMWRRLKRKVR